MAPEEMITHQSNSAEYREPAAWPPLRPRALIVAAG
jgi:hypothetical protein